MVNVSRILSMVGLLSAVALPALAADASPDGKQSALTWDFAPVYDAVEDSAVRIETFDHGMGSGVLLRTAGQPNCVVLTVHATTRGEQKIGVGERLGAWHVGTLVRADEQRQIDVYALEDIAADSDKCPAIKISQEQVRRTTLILGMGYPIYDTENPRALFGVVEKLDPVPPKWHVGGDQTRTIGMNWMPALPIDLGAGVFNTKGELVGMVNLSIPNSGAALMELSPTVQAALDAAHQPTDKKGD